MKIIVTGSESFVAKELIKQCTEQGIEVSGFDMVGPVIGDINDPNIGKLFPKDADAIVHLAALSRDPDCSGRPYECFQTNVMGTLNLMRAAQANGVKQFIFASSEWVYEKFQEGEEKTEDALIDIAGHISEYALSKLVSEANLRQQYLRGFMPTTILRFAIIYGPRKSNWSAVESLVSQVKNNDTVTVGSLNSGRRFIHVSDIARGIIASIGRDDFQIINLSGDRVITMANIIAKGQVLFDKQVKIVESNPNSASVRNPSNEKAKRILGWSPQVEFSEGIKTLIPYI